MKSIVPRNDKYEPHGYWKKFFSNGKIDTCGNFINGKKEGLWLDYRRNGELKAKVFFIL